ncbi:hypothetical protein [Streptomyces rhizosphaericus]|uniref:Uncharacterized protein n=2 Tax=Streptomyces rhizosphaericus TaxID=114699 RepID=A0ABN1SKM9_9ACTN|nr:MULTISPECIES: hypothetical protein [Streptomyces violaceusniger group]
MHGVPPGFRGAPSWAPLPADRAPQSAGTGPEPPVIGHLGENRTHPEPVELRRTARASGRHIVRAAGGRNESGGTAFDPKAYYSYSLDPADRVPSIVGSGSGPTSAIGATS